jgi:CheY-like chemotaxis protein
MTKRILLVDDDEGTRDELADLLAQEGFDVVEAIDGSDALERLRRGAPPDVIFLDLWMPNMQGWELHQRLKQDARLAAIPIVIMTAVPPKEREPIDAAAVVEKPFQFEEVLSVIVRLR